MGMLVDDLAEGLDEEVGGFVRVEAADREDNRLVVRDAELAARGGGPAGGVESGHVDAGIDGLGSGPAEDAGAPASFAFTFADGDEAIGGGPDHLFEQDEEAPSPGWHEVVEWEGVIGVNDNRHAAEPGGESTQESGFGGVGVDQVETFASEEGKDG